jgi:O-acetyl-ADP-ribose deacetylase (regulator of RNase III)
MTDVPLTLVGPRRLARAWRTAFRDTAVVIVQGDILAVARGKALVSPANSFGWMDGGLDDDIARVYRKAGVDIQERVQAAIRTQAGGELAVSEALVIPTPEGPFSHLISAPTMRKPHPVFWTQNAHLALRAVLQAVLRWNADSADTDALPIQAIYCPGLATGAGMMPSGRAARQMRRAWDQMQTPSPRES